MDSGGGAMTAIITMRDHVVRFIEMKCKLGYRFTKNAPVLLSFARYADQRNETFVRCATVIEWAQGASTPNQRVRKLRMVCNLANWLHAEDVRHEVPHPDVLGQRSSRRPTPHLMSTAQIRKLLAAAMEKGPKGTLNPLTWHYLFGLIGATGLRLGEALALTLDDVSADGLVVRDTKFGKSRLVPLHETTSNALECYLQARLKVNTKDIHLFVLSSTGRPPGNRYATQVFRQLARHAGIRKSDSASGPTARSLRHSFATRSIEQMNADTDPGRHMLALSTYLGHAGVSSSYWYLESTPVLLRDIASQVEQAHPVHCGGCND